MFKGKLEAFWETGSEGVHWFLYLDGKEGYDALYSIEEGDYITIYNEYNDIIYEGDIIQDKFSNWRAYSRNPIFGQQIAGNYFVHWLQANVNPNLWLSWFNNKYRATIKKSNITEEKREKIKNQIKENYYKNRIFKDVLIEKSKLDISLKNPVFYNTEGGLAIIEMLFLVNNEYQIFDDQYYTMVKIKEEESNEIKNINLNFIKKENFFEMKINEELIDQIKECIDFEKNNYSDPFERMNIFSGKVKDENYKKNQKKLKELKLKFGELLLEQLKEIESYKIKDDIVKLIKFNKKTTNFLKKDN